MIKKSLLIMLLMALFAPLAMNAQETLTVYDQGGSTTSSYVPFWGNWADNSLQCEMVYPATKLEDLAGGTITNLHLYTNGTDNISTTSATGSWDGTFQIFMKEVSETTITAFTGTTDATIVYEGQIPLVSGEMTIELTTPYTYGGGNLLVGFYYTTGGHYKSEYFLGETVSGASIYGRSGQSYSVNNGNFLPKTTFTYTPDANFCAKPTNLHVVGEPGPRGVTMAWNAEAGDSFQYALVSGHNIDPSTVTTFDGTTPTNEMTWNNLTPDSDYTVILRKVCGTDNYSQAVSVEFRTDVSCPAPTNLTVVDNSLTATNAQISWTGYSDSYIMEIANMSTATTTHQELLSEGFEGGSMPTDWTIEGNGTWTVGSGDYSTSTGTHTGTYNALITHGSTDNVTYLVMPAMNLSTYMNAKISCWYINRSWSGDTDGFGVYYRTSSTGAWVELFNTTSAHSTWTQTDELALPNEAFVQIGFKHLDQYGYGVGLDDILVEADEVALTWATASSNATSPYNFNNTLSPETTYAVRMTGVCSGTPSNPSDIFTFTTLPSCLVPTDLAVTEGSVTAHEATITWTENGDATSWDICVNDDETNLIHVIGTPSYDFTGLVGETTYSVKVLSNCSNGDSNWSSPVSFTTLVACPPPTNFSAEVDGTSVTLSWTGANSDIAWSLNANANPDDYIDPDFDIDQAHGTATMTDMALDTDYYFWVRTNCGGNDGTSTWVGPVSVHIGYCVPHFSSTGDYIDSFILGDINNTSSYYTTGGYSNHTDMTTTLEAGEPATATLTSSSGSGNHGAAIWIDFNDNLAFEDSERVGAYGNSIGASTTVTIDLTIPSDAVVGSHRMRVVYQYNTAGTSISPCVSGSYGEAEDYTVVIAAPSSCQRPTNISVEALWETANLSWTGTSNSYTVQYRVAETQQLAEGSFFDDFENGLGNWTLIVNAEGTGWQTFDATAFQGGSNYNGNYVAMARSYENGEDITADNWMITSKFTSIPSTMTYWAKNDGRSDHLYDETYDVCVSTNTNDPSDFVVIQSFTTAPDEWDQITIDLSAYAGRQGYIAFHHHDAEKDMILIDDVFIGTMEIIPAGEWQSKSTEGNETEIELDGLTPNTTYEYQVKGFCDDSESEWTTIGTFTTLSGCMTPTGLSAEVMGIAANLTWEGGADTYNLQYRKVDPNEPATIILTAGDVWGDGSGYQMLLDADATAYGDVFTATSGWTATNYNAFEYLIPTNAECSADATNIVYNNSVTIQIPAGTYDWCIVNPSPGDKIYIAASNGNVGGRQDNYVFEAGKTYEFVPNMYGENDGIDVTITAAWTPVSSVTSPYKLTELDPETTYEVQVQGVDCDGEGTYTDWSESVFFTTTDMKTFVTEGDWNVASNWSPEGLPADGEDVIIDAPATIPANYLANVGHVALGTDGAITIADGGQLRHTNAHTGEDVITVTLEKVINGYDDVNVKSGYYFIAPAPFYNTISPNSVENLKSDNYDFYSFSANASDGLEWINLHDSNTSLKSAHGYLYANSKTVTLKSTGQANSINGGASVQANYYSDNYDFNGWNLAGNPYVCNAYVYVESDNNIIETDFYLMNEDGDGYDMISSTDPIKPFEGVLVYTETAGSIRFSVDPIESSNGSKLNMNLSRNGRRIDMARVRFGEGQNLAKMSFRENSSKLFIPQNGKDYAMVYSEAQGEMPISFKAEKNGSYTLSFNNENVEFSYLHLIDNLTGADVDLLANPSYSFEAKTTDYASRFRLVFAQGDANSDNFAFFSNGNLVINNEGNATMNVYDVTGRLVNTQSINGSCEVRLNASAGVYMIQLVNGENTKTQKIVVK